MVGDVFADETLDEVVTVVMTRLQAQLQRMACGGTPCLQQFRFQLFGEELILSLIHI